MIRRIRGLLHCEPRKVLVKVFCERSRLKRGLVRRQVAILGLQRLAVGKQRCVEHEEARMRQVIFDAVYDHCDIEGRAFRYRDLFFVL